MGKMMLVSAALLALAQSVYGQTSSTFVAATTTSTSSQSSRTTSSVRPAETYKISVGVDHKFSPDITQALVGDLIEFDFMPLNHSVVRAEYKYPCIPYEKTGAGKVGFFGGFHPVDAILSNPPSWSVRINDSDPIFVYCSAPGSCINYGMVAVINPNASVSLATQKQMAKDSAFMLQPGEDFPPEQSSTPESTSISSTSSSSTSSATSAAATATSSSSSHKGGLPVGAIAGIAIGGFVVLALAAALFFFIGRTKSLQERVQRQSEVPSIIGSNTNRKSDSMYQVSAIPSPGYYPVHAPEPQRYSQVSSGGRHGDVPPYGAAAGVPSLNQSQYSKMKLQPGPGQAGWSSPTERGSVNGSPPPNAMQQQQGMQGQQQLPQQYYNARSGYVR
ncbi:hypothetical protein E6O75_ATG07636 [Venturia nashicola]|uniref:Extracellular serine-rich protein n=1 Tax=Venturia nashicola TaxID=86259 RepID=A0A4Z1PE81_9PEZI|nr:hypothetical protein E6O75_ATG07636 [Venturia nashicola]